MGLEDRSPGATACLLGRAGLLAGWEGLLGPLRDRASTWGVITPVGPRGVGCGAGRR